MTDVEKDQVLQDMMTEHGDMIKRVIYSYVRDRQRAEDIAQETFVKFYLSLHRFNGRASYKTYIYRIAVNESLNHLKSWHQTKVSFREKLKFWERRESTEDTYIQKERTSEFEAVLESIPLHYRETLWLYYYAELSVAEVADVLGCSANTVKTRLARGREQLREQLEVSGYEHQTVIE